MKHYYGFTNSGRSFTDHSIQPNEFYSAMGMVAVAFSQLEDTLSATIVTLLASGCEAGKIVVAELSFRAKVNLFASLVHHLKGSRTFAVPSHLELDEVLHDLCANAFNAEELRNTVMHSSWNNLEEYNFGKIVRSKATAKARHGFRITIEDVDPGYLVDIAEFTQSVATDVYGLVFAKIEQAEPSPTAYPAIGRADAPSGSAEA